MLDLCVYTFMIKRYTSGFACLQICMGWKILLTLIVSSWLQSCATPSGNLSNLAKGQGFVQSNVTPGFLLNGLIAAYMITMSVGVNN